MALTIVKSPQLAEAQAFMKQRVMRKEEDKSPRPHEEGPLLDGRLITTYVSHTFPTIVELNLCQYIFRSN